jgi:hypothetical protein
MLYTTTDPLSHISKKTGKTYRISIQEAPKGSYTTTVEAALNVLISSIKIK